MQSGVTPCGKDRSRPARFLLAGTALLVLLVPSLSLPDWLTIPLASAGDATPIQGKPPAETVLTGQRAQHLARLGVARWHQAGFRGQGVKVAVLDSGFRGYGDHLGKALPARVTVKSFRSDGNLEARDSQHGILCGEVLHAVAPQAELLFANWEPDRSDQFLEAVRWAKREGARVLSCSLIMPSWSDGEGNGAVHEELTQLLGDDLLCFASAGNTAERHWSGTFRDGGRGFHAWRDGCTSNRLTPWSDERVSVELCWKPGPGYELSVIDTDTGTEVGRSLARPATDRSYAVVSFTPAAGHTYAVRVRLVQGEGGPFHVVALSGGLGEATMRGSIPFPGDGPEVIAVGAVDDHGERLTYSSCGPNSKQPKPDLVAAVPFVSLCRSRPFSGTSAAAPQAAGLAALWWSRHSAWTASQVRKALRKAAEDLGPRGHDYETGYGLIRLP